MKTRKTVLSDSDKLMKEKMMKTTLQIAVLDLMQNWTMTVSKALPVAVTQKINWRKLDNL